MSFVKGFDSVLQPLKFMRGPKTLLAGVGWLLRHPKLLFLGAIPAVVAGALLTTGIVVLAIFSGSIADLITPLTESLWDWVAVSIHVALQSAVIAAGTVLAYVLFTSIALAIGDPIYSKIAETVDAEVGVLLSSPPWIDGVKDALSLALKGFLVAIGAFILSLLPIIGGFLAFILTWTLIPFFLSEELLGRTLVPRGFVTNAKTKLLLRDKRAVWSFGVTCQLLFSIPLLPIVVMPAAVAGAALLAQELTKPSEAE